MSFCQYIKGDSLTISTKIVDVNQLVGFLQASKVIKISLMDCNIGDEGVKELSRLTNITSLSLISCNIGDVGIKELAKLANLTSLNLSWNSRISDEGTKELAKLAKLTSLNLRWNNKTSDEGIKELAKLANLTSLNLEFCNIGNEGIKELAKLKKLKELCLGEIEVSSESIEALAKIKNSETNLSFKIESHGKRIFYDSLLEVYSNNQIIDEKSVKEVIFNVARHDDNGEIVKYILTQPDKYPFLINSKDEQGHTLFHFYTNNPEVQKFLFKHGLIPEKEVERDAELQNVLQDNQSVHASSIVKKTNFIAKKLVESIKANGNQLYQEVTSYVEGIPKLLEEYQNNQVKVGLLSLTKDEKKSVMEKTLGDNPVPNDKEFIKIVIDKAKDALEKQYLRKDQRGEFDQGYPTHRMQYDYARDDAKVTIPESIGYVKLLIDRFSIPLQERKELLVTLAQQNPRLVTEKLLQIRSELGDGNISEKQITDRTKFHELLKNVDPNKVNKLFKEMSGFDIEKTWREQKEFVLLKQIYVAATTYGENSNACTQGTWSQIINSISEIDSELMKQYDQHLEEEKKREEQKNSITEENITPFVEDLAKKLIQYVQNHSELKDTLLDFAIANTNIDKPEEITFKEQKILAQINQEFSASIKKFLPNYDRSMPREDEYKAVINELSKIVVMQNFVQSININNNQVTERPNKTINPQTELKDNEEISTQSQASVPNSADQPTSSNVGNTEHITPHDNVQTPTRQANNTKINCKQPNNQGNGSTHAIQSMQKSRRSGVVAFTLAIAGVASGVAIAVYLEMLAVGIAVGACCLIAAAIVYYCNQPSKSLESSNAQMVNPEKLKTSCCAA